MLAVGKPAGMPSQGDKTGDLSVLDWAREYIRVAYDKPGDVFMGLVHRLDRPVSGAMILARTSKAASRLSAAFRDRTVRKVYAAIVESMPSAEPGEVSGWLIPGQGRRNSVWQANPSDGAQRSVLKWKPVCHVDGGLLVQVELLTGRKHQIRAQFSALGAPIVGDKRYGAQKRFATGMLALHSARLNLPAPVGDDRLDIVAPIPDEWNVPVDMAREFTAT